MIPWATLMIGYRLHPVGHAGFQFRIGFSALIGVGLGLASTKGWAAPLQLE